MTTINYQIERQDETGSYIVYVFETRHATTGDEYEPPYSIGQDFATRHEAEAFIREVA